VIWNSVIWPIYVFKNWLRYNKTSKGHIFRLILWRHKDYVTENTSSKWCHKNFPFSSPSLCKILVALLPVTKTSNISAKFNKNAKDMYHNSHTCFLTIWKLGIKHGYNFKYRVSNYAERKGKCPIAMCPRIRVCFSVWHYLKEKNQNALFKPIISWFLGCLNFRRLLVNMQILRLALCLLLSFSAKNLDWYAYM